MALQVSLDSPLGRVYNGVDVIPIFRGATARATRTTYMPIFRSPAVFEWKLSSDPYESYIDGKRVLRALI